MFQGSAVTGETGIEMEDLQKLFDEADFDNSSSICLPEFERLGIYRAVRARDGGDAGGGS